MNWPTKIDYLFMVFFGYWMRWFAYAYLSPFRSQARLGKCLKQGRAYHRMSVANGY